jgi:hypothetical protein
MFGIAAALGLAISPAWAGDEKSEEKAASDTVASKESGKSKSVSERESATGIVVEAGRDSGTMRESNEVRASSDERWLREREGYRDGGY